MKSKFFGFRHGKLAAFTLTLAGVTGCATPTIPPETQAAMSLKEQILGGYTQRLTVTENSLLNHVKISSINGSGFEIQDKSANWLESYFKKSNKESLHYLYQEISYSDIEWRSYYSVRLDTDVGPVKKGLTASQRKQSDCQATGKNERTCSFSETVHFGLSRQEIGRLVDSANNANEQFIKFAYQSVLGTETVVEFPILEAEAILSKAKTLTE